jgi:hypothetical protein
VKDCRLIRDKGVARVVWLGDGSIPGGPEEPVAWYAPIVMNTEAQLRQAMIDLRDGTFIKHS